MNELEREALDLSTASHNRSLNDCKFFTFDRTISPSNNVIPALYRSPITATNAMNDTVAELRSRPYQMAHVRSAASQNGSTVVDDDARKSDYKRIVSNNTVTTGGSTGGTQTPVKWRKVRIDGPQLFVLRENMRKVRLIFKIVHLTCSLIPVVDKDHPRAFDT